MRPDINIIVAVGNYIVGKGFPIGRNGGMPWKNKADMKWFKEMTINNIVIMGKTTYESIGNALKDRINIIISHHPDKIANAEIVPSIEDAVKLAESYYEKDNAKKIFVIGGANIYKQFLEKDLVDRIYMDALAENVDGADAFFPDILTKYEWEETGAPIEIEHRKAYAITYEKMRGFNNHVDEQYLKIANEIIEKGERKESRAGVTRSLFGCQMRFNLKYGLPMLTTKKMFSKGVIHELLWFISGDTNIKYLVDNGVHIWDDDAYRFYLEKAKYMTEKMTKEEFLDAVVKQKVYWLKTKIEGHLVPYQAGNLGPVYGEQWNNFGGHNQIQEVIDTLKTNPDDRRMIVSAWNPEEIPYMALPPCHFCFQFYTRKMSYQERLDYYKNRRKGRTFSTVTEKMLDDNNVPTRKLSCMFHMRSNDWLLGNCFNVLSYSVLVHMIAQCANMDVDELIFDGGDCHIYENQIEIYEKEQKNRNPHMYALPKLWLNPEIKDIDDFTFDDIKIIGYKSYPAVKYPLSVGLKENKEEKI